MYTTIGMAIKKLSSPYAHKLRKGLKLMPEHTFSDAFPQTDLPKIQLVASRPIIEKEMFKTLVTLKLQQARQLTGLNHNPKCYPAIISTWITSLLRAVHSQKKQTKKNTPAPVPKKKSKKSSQPEHVDTPRPKTPEPLSSRFVSSTENEAPQQTASQSSSPADSNSEFVMPDVIFDGKQIWSYDHSTAIIHDDLSKPAPNIPLSFPFPLPQEFNHAELRALEHIVKTFLIMQTLSAPIPNAHYKRAYLAYLVMLHAFGLKCNLFNSPDKYGLSFTADGLSPISTANHDIIKARLNDMSFLYNAFHYVS
jgi:hypothetical protein